jgi:hypothetical protein
MLGAADMAADLAVALAWQPLLFARGCLLAACALGVLLPGGQHGLLVGREGTHPQFLSVVDTLWRMGSRCRQPAAVASISLCANSGGSLR